MVISLEGRTAASLSEDLYCARGEAENRIKEAQIELFGRRGKCRDFAANQLRLLFATLAYTLMVNLRRLALKGGAGARLRRHHPRQAAQDRRGGAAEHGGCAFS